jgi:hypothetical protein
MREIVRNRILDKYKHQCNYCGSKENLQIDHIIPLNKGGIHSENNFQILCRSCNSKKKDKYNFDEFFKQGDGKTYILINTKLVRYLNRLKPNEFVSVTEQKFEELC